MQCIYDDCTILRKYMHTGDPLIREQDEEYARALAMDMELERLRALGPPHTSPPPTPCTPPVDEGEDQEPQLSLDDMRAARLKFFVTTSPTKPKKRGRRRVHPEPSLITASRLRPRGKRVEK